LLDHRKWLPGHSLADRSARYDKYRCGPTAVRNHHSLQWQVAGLIGLSVEQDSILVISFEGGSLPKRSEQLHLAQNPSLER
jgi:hypothetical protein